MTKRFLPNLRDAVKIVVERPVTPRVHDEDDTRCLRFNEGVVQSTMRHDDPFALELAYTRAMMGFLLFHPEPRHVLIVGLGGGSLSKYCYRAFPKARITTLEINPEVIALRDHFLIPPDDERFQVVQVDGGEYLLQSNVRADVIMLDAYDAHGLPPDLCSESFYTQCHTALGDEGVLVVNLWGGEPNRARYIERLSGLFDGRVWWSKPRDSSGLIVYAVKNENFFPQWSQIMASARALDARFRLDLVSVVNDLRARPEPDG